MALEYLKFQSYSKADYSGSPLRTVFASVNPENYQLGNTNNFGSFNVKGDSEQTYFFNNVGGRTLKITKMLVDATGIIPLKGFNSVENYLDALSAAVFKYNGNMHMPPYVKITWGSLVFKGICTAYSVNYTLFKTDGTALRAFVDMEFKSSTDPQTKAKQAANNSPDLTHIRTVTAGDTLPLMTYRIYGDSSYYLEIARINGLKHVNDIRPGDQLYFPPLKK